ncbi:MAG: type II toxin-antitoxin system PemK/MazF family toxin [Coriobacteriia bacterium]|nr:type II toxin-antitoxin system PemK/MazF family toxin [Coriobacteriia bacterium]
MKQGEVWLSAGTGYLRKPRPVVIVQSNGCVDSTQSVTLLLLTSCETRACSNFRILVRKDAQNGLEEDSYLMIDKLVTVPKNKLGKQLGSVSDETLGAILAAITKFLGIRQEHI